MSDLNKIRPEDAISKLRRAEEITQMAARFGLVLNDDGSVYDKKSLRQFNSIVDWSRETS